MAEIYIKVVPGSENFDIEFNDFPTIYLESEPEHGKANSELINRLKNILGEKPAIVSGHRSRRKKIKVGLEKEEIRGRLERHG